VKIPFWKIKECIYLIYIDLKKILDIRFHKNIFVFGMPYHSNAGDQAQSFCIEKWLKKNYPHFKVRLYDTWSLTENDFELLRKIRKMTKQKDKIFLHSGYHMTDIYMLEENMQRKVIELFSPKRIVLFPQTIFYKKKQEQERTQKIYDRENVLIMCRDNISYDTAKTMFSKCKLLLFPDIVTTMIGNYHYEEKRKGILLCTRNDSEALITTEQYKQLLKRLGEVDEVFCTDTTLTISAKEFLNHREQILLNLWKDYAKYRVIVTDRYHGTIFALIANTPVVVMSSTDHKLESGVNWFPKSFSQYVRYVKDTDRVADEVKKIYGENVNQVLTNYFEQEYYDKLKKLIEEKYNGN